MMYSQKKIKTISLTSVQNISTLKVKHAKRLKGTLRAVYAIAQLKRRKTKVKLKLAQIGSEPEQDPDNPYNSRERVLGPLKTSGY
jgi:hypothetical protein